MAKERYLDAGAGGGIPAGAGVFSEQTRRVRHSDGRILVLLPLRKGVQASAVPTLWRYAAAHHWANLRRKEACGIFTGPPRVRQACGVFAGTRVSDARTRLFAGRAGSRGTCISSRASPGDARFTALHFAPPQRWRWRPLPSGLVTFSAKGVEARAAAGKKRNSYSPLCHRRIATERLLFVCGRGRYRILQWRQHLTGKAHPSFLCVLLRLLETGWRDELLTTWRAALHMPAWAWRGGAGGVYVPSWWRTARLKTRPASMCAVAHHGISYRAWARRAFW